jgi:hypothetical protein
MLHELLSKHHSALIERCREKVGRHNPAIRASDRHGIPLFLDQVIATLQRETALPHAPITEGSKFDIGATAASHGGELLRSGVTISEVVHEYGNLCQAIAELATEQRVVVTAREFGTLNRCLDDAIAAAITEFGQRLDQSNQHESARLVNERLGSLAHELRNFIANAMLAVASIRHGAVGVGGATGALLDRSLLGLRDLVDRILVEVQTDKAAVPSVSRIDVARLVADVHVAAALEATALGLDFVVRPVDSPLAVEGDALVIAGAVINLLQNAVKFTRPHGRIGLAAYASAGDVLIEVEDQCGGLLAGREDTVFEPFQRQGPSSGVGLGLTISRRGVEANGGSLSARNVAGTGCVFTIRLPRVANIAE